MRTYGKRVLFFTLILVLGAILGACAKKPKPEEPCNFIQNGDLQRVSWGDGIPVVLRIDESVPPQHYAAIEDAIKSWNIAYKRQILQLAGVTRSGQPGRDGANVIYWYGDSWDKAKPNEQARTTVYWQGDRIQEADIRVNAYNFDYFSGNTPAAGKVDLQSLLVHELGHVLGLGHTSVKQSVMVRDLPLATSGTKAESLNNRRVPQRFDLNSLACEY